MTAAEPVTPHKRPRPRYAAAGNPKIAATLNSLFKFTTRERAEAKLAEIRRQFTVTRQIQEGLEEGSYMILWIRDFEVDQDEEMRGYLGNYALLKVVELPKEDLWTISAEKIERPLKNHPLRKRPASRCPNWGHPILRSIQKEKRYETMQEAIGQLEALHLEYPETTIPADNMCKLYLMIFSRRTDATNPIQKYVFEVKNQQAGGFMILSKVNDYKPKSRTILPKPDQPAPEKLGHFASMVALKKQRKKKSD